MSKEKVKILLRNKIHKKERSHDVTIIQKGDKKIKLTYETYNAVERFNTEVFDGEKLNLIATIDDLGVERNCSAYNILTPEQREKRTDELYVKALKFLDAIM